MTTPLFLLAALLVPAVVPGSANPVPRAADAAGVPLVQHTCAPWGLRADEQAPAPKAETGPAVTGRVTFEGPLPEVPPLPATTEQQKGCCPDGGAVPLTDPTLVVDAKGGIANVVVTIEVDGVTAEPAEKPVVVDQKRCVFEPHVAVMHAGSKVEFVNSDTVSHNVRASSLKNDSFNWVMTPGGKEDVVFQKSDRVEIRCDYHPWMSMILYVTDTPYHAVTATDGTFSIRGLKPGTYKAKLWHEKLGRKDVEIVVQDDGSCAPVAVQMAPKKKKS